jgi:hypothetical protein
MAARSERKGKCAKSFWWQEFGARHLPVVRSRGVGRPLSAIRPRDLAQTFVSSPGTLHRQCTSIGDRILLVRYRTRHHQDLEWEPQCLNDGFCPIQTSSQIEPRPAWDHRNECRTCQVATSAERLVDSPDPDDAFMFYACSKRI